MRVEPIDDREIIHLEPTRERAGQDIIEGRLAALLLPHHRLVGPLHRERAALRHMRDEGVMVELVGGLEDGHDQAVGNAKPDEQCQDGDCSADDV